jgi:hypothetical protein
MARKAPRVFLLLAAVRWRACGGSMGAGSFENPTL